MADTRDLEARLRVDSAAWSELEDQNANDTIVIEREAADALAEQRAENERHRKQIADAAAEILALQAQLGEAQRRAGGDLQPILDLGGFANALHAFKWYQNRCAWYQKQLDAATGGKDADR